MKTMEKEAGNNTINSFLAVLASREPVPGGGGASALIGAVGAALCSMVANLTTGKKKYAEYQADIEAIIERMQGSIARLLQLIDGDAAVFEPLAKAYGIPREEPGREAILENALHEASAVPLQIVEELDDLTVTVAELSVKGSRLAISDVGVAAAAVRAAAQGAAMNVFINTKLMKDTGYALALNDRTNRLLEHIGEVCNAVYGQIKNELEIKA
jgi:methenyltetrahydrofolate cyclohydrolase